MSTSLLFHAFGIRGYQLQKTEFKEGNIYFYITQNKRNIRCPNCQSFNVIKKGTRKREFRSVPIGSKKTFIVMPSQRVLCKECHEMHYVKVKFAKQGKRYTHTFRKYALGLLQFSTVFDVAKHLGVSWDLIKEIDKSDLNKFQNPSFKDLKQIAIDEISVGKMHKYITVVLDIEEGAVMFLGDGKGSDSLELFWKKLKISKAKIEAVATDMSPAYIKAVEENIPDAVHVADPFHIVKLFNDKLSELRRDIYNESSDGLKKNSERDSVVIIEKP